MRNTATSFFTRISIILLATIFFFQIPASAKQPAADDLVDHFVYLPVVSKKYAPLPSGEGNVSGYVTDARSGVGIGGAEVCFQDTICDTTDNTGFFTLIDIEDGAKTFSAAAIGYGRDTEFVVVVADQTVFVNFNLLPDLDEGEIRVVLTWDTTRTWGDNIPNDLNLHLWTDYAEPDDHIYIDNTGNCQDLESLPFACYENDKQFGSGPDTIVLQNNIDDFKFAVLNENASYPGVPPITQLSARVEVFEGQNRIADYVVPTTGLGDLWYVFDLNGGTVEIQDCIMYYSIDGDAPQDCP